MAVVKEWLNAQQRATKEESRSGYSACVFAPSTGDHARCASAPSDTRNLARRFQIAQASQLPWGVASQAVAMVTVAIASASSRPIAAMKTSSGARFSAVGGCATARRRKASYPAHARTATSTTRAAGRNPSSVSKRKNSTEVRPIPRAAPDPKISDHRAHAGRIPDKAAKRCTSKAPSRIASTSQISPATLKVPFGRAPRLRQNPAVAVVPGSSRQQRSRPDGRNYRAPAPGSRP